MRAHCPPKLSYTNNPPAPLQTIPAKAGISQSYVANNTKICRHTSVPHRPFLRKQESHSHMSPTIPKSADTLPFPADHSCVGRNLQGDSPPATMAATTMPNPPTIPHFPTRPFLRKQESLSHGRHRCLNFAALPLLLIEIPAYAGMVHGGTEIHRRIRQLSPPANKLSPTLSPKIYTHLHFPHRPFLRKQESPGRQPSGDNGGDNNATFTNNPPSPTRPFLRRQESHSHMLPIIPNSTDTLPFPHSPFLRRQESLFNRRQRRLILATMQTHHCEIPAFAGMVHG